MVFIPATKPFQLAPNDKINQSRISPAIALGRISLSGNLMVTERNWRAAASPG
jgi:hypothetical protein